MNNKNNLIVIILIIVIVGLTGAGIYFTNKKEQNNSNPIQEEPIDKTDVSLTNNFNLDMIKLVNSREKSNYLISAYSMEIALNMLKDGASGETYKQIEKVVPKRDIPIFNIDKRISVANAVFVKDEEKDNISSKYINSLKTDYKADLIYDKFTTPDKINNWVNEKTYGMIPKILDEMSKDFVLGLANAVAIDVEWYTPFECESTSSANFTRLDGSKKNVEMMHESFSRNANYIKNENEEGVILPYVSYTSDGEKDYDNKDTSTRLEFVAIMPTKTDITTYINELTNDKLNITLNGFKSLNSNQELMLGLPRFEYDYKDEEFANDLMKLGITDMFDGDKADFSKMNSETSKNKLYVSQAIHMTHISLNEKGTKAAAVTFFGMDKAIAMPVENEYIRITFDKPFMYMIRDTKTKEILFFGVVENPNEWKGSTCNNID